MSKSAPAFLGQTLPVFKTSFSRPHTCKRPPSLKRIRPQFIASVERELDPLSTAPLGAPKIICFGEALFDLFSESTTAPITDLSLWMARPGGAPANLAVGLAKLSTGSAFVGSVGDDNEGTELRRLLADANVNVDALQTVVGQPTRRVFVRRDESGERAFVGFSGKNDQFADTAEIDLETLPGVLFYAAEILVTGTLALAFPGSASALKELVNVAGMCKLQTVVDVNWRDVFWDGQASDADAREKILAFLRNEPGADLVKASLEDLAFLLGDTLASRALDEPDAVLRELGGKCSGVLVTAGADGAAYAFEGGMDPIIGRVAATVPKGGIVDGTGAGDAFLAGFLSEMMRLGGPFALTDKIKAKHIVEFATAVASFVVAGPGAIDPQPTREQVEAVMEQRVA